MTLLFLFWLLAPYFVFWGLVLKHMYPVNSNPTSPSQPQEITLICSIRNEETLLNTFLSNLVTLEERNPGLLHYILIDDQSTDSTFEILTSFLGSISFKNRILLLQTSPENHGKKQALNLAFEQTKTPWAYVTDADCIIHWDSIDLLRFESQNGALAVFGPVIYTGENTFLQSYQVLENSALMVLGNFQSSRGNKTMGNAANMLIHVRSFIDCLPYESNSTIAGGDDIFLIEAFKKSGYKIATVTLPDAAVFTIVLHSWKDFWNQRIRWAKKSRFQSFKNTQFSQILMVVFLLLLLIFSLWCITFEHYVELAILWGTKVAFDVFLLGKITRFYNQSISIWHRVFSSLFQVVFIPTVAVSQFFCKVHWKDRHY